MNAPIWMLHLVWYALKVFRILLLFWPVFVNYYGNMFVSYYCYDGLLNTFIQYVNPVCSWSIYMLSEIRKYTVLFIYYNIFLLSRTAINRVQYVFSSPEHFLSDRQSTNKPNIRRQPPLRTHMNLDKDNRRIDMSDTE